jgi:radical SAM protein with 4Fe4S-binding SPASM domain
MPEKIEKTKRPERVFLELIDKCNLRCPMCPCTKKGTAGTSLDYQLADGIIDLFSENLPVLHLYEWGEPLLYKNIREIVKKAVSLKYKTRLSSNFFNTSVDMIRFIARSGIDKLRISIDASTSPTYSLIRRGGSFDNVVNNINLLLNERNSAGRTKPQVELAFIIMRHNQHEIDSFKDFASGLGVERIRYKTLSVFSQEEIAMLPDDARFHAYIPGTLTPRKKVKMCIMPYKGCLIGADGQVYPCGRMKAGGYKSFGNLHEKSFDEIWNGKEAEVMRSKMVEDPMLIDVCRDCPGNAHPLREIGMDKVRFK